MKMTTKQVTFRLPAEFVKQLDERAKQHNMSEGQYARKLVIDALQNTDQMATQATLDLIGRELPNLRMDLATAVKILLVMVGSCDEQEAETWVQREMLSRND